MHPSAHTDTFTRDNLPPEDQRPVFLNTLPALEFPARLNCVEPLLDAHIREGRGDRPAVRSLEESWTYAELAERVNRIANLLVERENIKPGNRVLMRFPNSPVFAACYLAVLKCGAVAVPTMPLLRARELKVIADKAEASHALADSSIALVTTAALYDRKPLEPRSVASTASQPVPERLYLKTEVDLENGSVKVGDASGR